MAVKSKGRKTQEKTSALSSPTTLRCQCCNDELGLSEFYISDSALFRATGKIPYCKECIGYVFEKYQEEYEKLGYASPDKKAIERMCMMLDLYYSDEIVDGIYKIRNSDDNSRFNSMPLIAAYMCRINMIQHKNKNYNTTIHERYEAARQQDQIDKGYDINFYTDDDSYKNDAMKSSIKIFGKGFSNDDYVYLYDQYCDWTSRHECNTKAQEEVFKNICLTQLQLLKAMKNPENTTEIKDLSTQLQKWLDTGKLQPKQNSGDVVSDAQTFGTLIDKWENTRPIPEVDASLEDIDKLGVFVDVLLRGHLAKTAGIPSGYSDKYDDFMKQFSVEREEYFDEEDNEAIYEALFGASAVACDNKNDD